MNYVIKSPVCKFIIISIAVNIMRDELLRMLITTRQNRNQEVDHFSCSSFIRIVKVQTLVDGFDTEGLLVGLMLQNQLLEVVKSLLVDGLLAHLN